MNENIFLISNVLSDKRNIILIKFYFFYSKNYNNYLCLFKNFLIFIKNIIHTKYIDIIDYLKIINSHYLKNF